MDLPEVRPTATKVNSHDRAPLEVWSLTFLTVTTVVWLGLLDYIPFKVCICAMHLFFLGAEVSEKKYRKKKVSACWSSDLTRAAFQSGGVLDLYSLYWPSQLTWAVSHITLKFPVLSDHSLWFCLQVFFNCVTLYPSHVGVIFWIQIQLNSG